MFKSKYTGEEIEAILDDAKTPYTLPIASSDTLGGVKTNYTQSGKNYPVKTDSSGNAYVNVPWSDTNTTYGVVSTSANGLMPKLPTTNIVIGDNTSTPAMQVLTGDGKYRALSLGYNQIINKLTLGFYDATTGVGSVGTTIPVASSTADGLMSKTDKSKLDDFHSVMSSNGAFILTEAGISGKYVWDDINRQMIFNSMDVPGNWFTGDEWEFAKGNIFSLPDIPTATTTTGGIMSPTDKANLNNSFTAIYSATSESDDANKHYIKFSGSAASNGFGFLGAKPCIKFYGVNGATPPGQPNTEKAFIQALTIDEASPVESGLMSKEDKKNLDALSETMAASYNVPSGATNSSVNVDIPLRKGCYLYKCTANFVDVSEEIIFMACIGETMGLAPHIFLFCEDAEFALESSNAIRNGTTWVARLNVIRFDAINTVTVNMSKIVI